MANLSPRHLSTNWATGGRALKGLVRFLGFAKSLLTPNMLTIGLSYSEKLALPIVLFRQVIENSTLVPPRWT